jgi:hypothetical protein
MCVRQSTEYLLCGRVARYGSAAVTFLWMRSQRVTGRCAATPPPPPRTVRTYVVGLDTVWILKIPCKIVSERDSNRLDFRCDIALGLVRLCRIAPGIVPANQNLYKLEK